MSAVKFEDYLRVPRLEVDGTNWVIYKDQLQWAADARTYLRHIDGSATSPTAPPAPADPAAPTAAETALLTAYNTSLTEWMKGEATMKQLIASTIPDSLFMKVRNKPTALEIWTTLANEFQNKSRMVSVDLHRRLQDKKAGNKDDLRAHFNELRTMRENLASMGHPPTEQEFYSIVLGSLPDAYDTYVSAVLATSSILASSSVSSSGLTADELMQTVTEEYDRRTLKSKGRGESKDAAFTANERGGQKKGKCHNCGKSGHFKRDCWAPGGGKEGQGPKGKGKVKEKSESKDKASVAKADEKPEEAAWMAEDLDFEELMEDVHSEPHTDDDSLFDEVPEYAFTTKRSEDDDETSIPDLQTVSDSEIAPDHEEDEISLKSSTTAPVEDYTLTFDYAFLAKTGPTNVEVEIIDSGASRHMSPYKHRFINFTTIES